MKKIHILALLKIFSSISLIAATVGLAWHEYRGIGHWPNDFGKHSPEWLRTLLGGPFPIIFEDIFKLFSKSSFTGAAYAFAVVLSLISIITAPFIYNNKIRLIVCVPILIAFLYSLTVLDIFGELPDQAITGTIIRNASFGFDGTAFVFNKELARNTIFVSLVAIPILWKIETESKLIRRGSVIVFIMCLTTVVAIVVRTGGHTRLFPPPVTQLIDFAMYWHRAGDANIEPVNYHGDFNPKIKKVIFVMDESVRGDYISINEIVPDTTPFLMSIRENIANYGIAASATNCSIESRLSIRHLVSQSDFGRSWTELQSRPTIWQYAKEAGYQTIYIDSFGSPFGLSSAMTQTERSFIDKRITVNERPFYKRDPENANIMKSLLNESGYYFIFLDKYGTHIPYDGMYPKEQNIFGAQDGFDLGDVDNLIKHYKNAIRWSVDGFFRILLSSNLPESTLIIYTADHGQSLSEGSRISHCSGVGNLRLSESSVPLFAISTDSNWSRSLQNSSKFNRNRLAHVNVPATLLLAFGYDQSWVDKNFDPSLIKPIPQEKRRKTLLGGKTVVPFDE